MYMNLHKVNANITQQNKNMKYENPPRVPLYFIWKWKNDQSIYLLMLNILNE